MSVGLMIAMVVLGLVAGVASGMFGIGGGAIMVPALVLIFAFDQKIATGTSLGAQILPVGLLAAYEYNRRGELDIKTSALITVGLIFGAYIGAKIAAPIDSATMKKLYGAFLLIIGVRYIFFK